jgi:3-oxoacyl-[acyl-carrier protein] reductase
VCTFLQSHPKTNSAAQKQSAEEKKKAPLHGAHPNPRVNRTTPQPFLSDFSRLGYLPSMQPVALVTGAGTGLGSALAEKLAAAGYAVALVYRNSKEGVLRRQQSIRDHGGTSFVFRADLAKESEAQALARSVQETWGRLDVVVNCSGNYSGGSLSTLTETEWNDGLDSTIHAAFHLTRATLPLLRASGHGRLIHLGDSSCDRPTARDMALGYHIGKTGVLMLVRSVAAEEARHGVTVNMVSPGWLENSVDLPPAESLPAGRYGTFDDIWNAVEFLLKPESGYLTGSNLVVSGGWNLR